MNGEIFKNILTDNFNEIEYKEHEIEKRVGVIDVLERLSDWRYDNDIAEELDVKVVTIRKLLNELHEFDLVTYRRAKNKETGWYTYIWKRREDKAADYVNEYLNFHLLNLRNNLEHEESNVWLVCSCDRVTLDCAMESNFIKIKKIESDIRNIRDLMKRL
ncbi:MAG: hypothetical protein A7315_14950 [Candidatus Altiarchaeales archaeon WOR_SM1_79]|nr:MAG: hypothetical protein A7315_14950 [Candidatus Altiarchaeales archaeon WOR_SM1_79]